MSEDLSWKGSQERFGDLSKSQRTKGHGFERYVANKLKHLFPDARRGIDQTQAGTQPDVEGTPFWVEAKHWAAPPSPWKVFQQAVDKMAVVGDCRPPLIVVRRTRGFTYWALKEEDFLALLEKAYATSQD